MAPRLDRTSRSSAPAPARSHSAFHEVMSSSVPASHHKGTRRARPHLAIAALIRTCGRSESSCMSPSRSWAISDTRSPQQHANRKIVRSMRTRAEYRDRLAKSANTAASSPRSRILVESTFQVQRGIIEASPVMRGNRVPTELPRFGGELKLEMTRRTVESVFLIAAHLCPSTMPRECSAPRHLTAARI
jgi:hypothetical protein